MPKKKLPQTRLLAELTDDDFKDAALAALDEMPDFGGDFFGELLPLVDRIRFWTHHTHGNVFKVTTYSNAESISTFFKVRRVPVTESSRLLKEGDRIYYFLCRGVPDDVECDPRLTRLVDGYVQYLRFNG